MNGYYCTDCGTALDLTASYLGGDGTGLLSLMRCSECGGVYAGVVAGDDSVLLHLASGGTWEMTNDDGDLSLPDDELVEWPMAVSAW